MMICVCLMDFEALTCFFVLREIGFIRAKGEFASLFVGFDMFVSGPECHLARQSESGS